MGSFDTVMIAGCHRGWIIVTLPYQSFLNSLENSLFFHGGVNGTSVCLYFGRGETEYLFFILELIRVWLIPLDNKENLTLCVC